MNILEREGSADPIVFLHGLGGSSRYWTCKLDEARLENHSIFVDLLGFGDSPQPWCQYTAERHLSALSSALRPYGAVTLVGHSLGAALALMYAALYPERVKAIVLISLPYFQSQMLAYEWLRKTSSGWLFTNRLSAGLTNIVARRTASWMVPKLGTNYPEEVIEDIAKHHVMSSVTSLWNVIYSRDLRLDAEKIPPNKPVLCIHSVDDNTAPFAAVEALAHDFPGWRLWGLQDAQHHPWLWNAKACCKGINKFLTDLPG